MKKYILSFAVLLLFSFTANAQLLTPYKAKAGLTAATNLAAQAITNPRLRGIGAAGASGVDAPIALEVNINNGNSTLWIYAFEETGNSENTKVIALLSLPFLGYVDASTIAGDIPLDDFLIFLPNRPLPDNDWMDSDVMAGYLRNDSEYKSLASRFPTATVQFAAMGLNEINPLLPQNQPFWSLIFTSPEAQSQDGLFTCAVHAKTGDVTCFSFTSVNEHFAGQIKTYPNPTTDLLVIDLGEKANEIEKIELISSEGVVFDQVPVLSSTSLNTSNLVAGNYYLRFIGNGISYVSKFNVVR